MSGRAWRTWRVVPLEQVVAYGVRFWLAPAMLAIQIYLYYLLWTSVYSNSTAVSGLTVKQVVSYATLALLVARIRGQAKGWTKDTIPQRLRDGTIIYLFLRPVSPMRAYLFRSLGSLGYGLLWSLVGYAIALATGIVGPPPSAEVAWLFLAGLLLGQVILYYIGQIVEVATFWLYSNLGLARMYFFLQDLMSGVFVPLWFMPAWLLSTANVLPFSAAINFPVSLYVGRIPTSQASGYLLREALWCLVLALATRLIWARAARRVTIQGG
jgi:ABC-2 type transport system permease protein